MNIRGICVLLVGALASIASTGPGGDPPPTDFCAPGQEGQLDSLELYLGTNGDSGPAQDGDSAPIVWGFQGAAMVPITYDLTGPDIPACLAQQVQVELCTDGITCEQPEPVRTVTNALSTHESPSGRNTRPYYLEIYYPAEPTSVIRLTIEASNYTLVRTLQLHEP